MAKGFFHEYGIDDEEAFAPMAKMTSIRVLIELVRYLVFLSLSYQVFRHCPFLEMEGHFCPLNCVMAWWWFVWRDEGRMVILAQIHEYINPIFSKDEKYFSLASSSLRVSRKQFKLVGDQRKLYFFEVKLSEYFFKLEPWFWSFIRVTEYIWMRAFE